MPGKGGSWATAEMMNSRRSEFERQARNEHRILAERRAGTTHESVPRMTPQAYADQYARDRDARWAADGARDRAANLKMDRVQSFTVSPTFYQPSSRTPIDPRVAEQREIHAMKVRQSQVTHEAFFGVPNPYGKGIHAYEPETEVWTPPKADRGVATDGQLPTSGGVGVQPTAASVDPGVGETGSTAAGTIPGVTGGGSIANVIAAAKTMLGKPYVWGGTTSTGVDCSGLIFYAFNQAGIKMPRYRAVDYGHMGQGVNADEARPGDLVYWDEKGDTDHVGIYLGDGYVIQSPQTGDVTKISKVWGNAQYRRIFDDKAFGKQATPTGAVTSYDGKPADFYGDVVSIASPVSFSRRGSGAY